MPTALKNLVQNNVDASLKVYTKLAENLLRWNRILFIKRRYSLLLLHL